jgi:hypothetical protein
MASVSNSGAVVATSLDGTVWTTQPNIPVGFIDLASTGSHFLANRGTGGRDVSLSSDGITWIDYPSALPVGAGQSWLFFAAPGRFRWQAS